MELLSTEFLAALAAIVVIDLVLAGDNAIVIALAVRTLPPRKRRLGIVTGTAAAAGMRILFTLIATRVMRKVYTLTGLVPSKMIKRSMN